jgi:uncharacterized protein (TIGR02284 family)
LLALREGGLVGRPSGKDMTHRRMEMSSRLTDLGHYVHDSIDGYRKAHERADDPDLRAAFASRIDRREATLARINAALTAGKEERVTSGSTLGTFHEIWGAVLKSLGGNDRAVISHVEEGEDFLKQRFEECLRDEDISPRERGVIVDCLREIAEAEYVAERLDNVMG